jgi:hypothetical protein
MKAILALGENARLAEADGRWRVIVDPSGPLETLRARIIDCVASCAADHRLQYATISLGSRSFALYPPALPPVAAAAAA